jgi:hypothetical protein
MADSFGKRQRERAKQQKARDKAERKRERGETPAPPPVQGATWYELVGEEGGAAPGDAGADASAEERARLRRESQGG